MKHWSRSNPGTGAQAGGRFWSKESRMTESTPEPKIYRNYNYRSALWKEGERFHIEQAELGIRVHDTDLHAAYEKFNASLEAALKEYQDSGSEPPSPGEGFEGRRLGFGGEIKLFLAKTAIVGMAVGVIMVFGLNYAVVKAVDTAANRAIGLIPRVMSGGVATQGYIAMHKISERLRQATPEERDDLHRDLRTIARELKPFLLELQEP